MKYMMAKVGTHGSQRILHIKGKIKLNERIEWVEGPDYRAKYDHRCKGIIVKINSDGLIFIERM